MAIDRVFTIAIDSAVTDINVDERIMREILKIVRNDTKTIVVAVAGSLAEPTLLITVTA